MAKTLPAFTSDGLFSNDQLTVRWVEDGARFHIWFARNPSFGGPAGSELQWVPKSERVKFHSEQRRVYIYKNPPVGLKSREEGWFETRKMDADANKWAAILTAATEYANSGAPERITQERREREEREAQEEAAKANDAHGAATKERLHAFAQWLLTDPDHADPALGNYANVLAARMTNAQADRLSAFVHDLV